MSPYYLLSPPPLPFFFLYFLVAIANTFKSIVKCKTDSECCPQSFLFCTPMDNTRKCWHHI